MADTPNPPLVPLGDAEGRPAEVSPPGTDFAPDMMFPRMETGFCKSPRELGRTEREGEAPLEVVEETCCCAREARMLMAWLTSMYAVVVLPLLLALLFEPATPIVTVSFDDD